MLGTGPDWRGDIALRIASAGPSLIVVFFSSCFLSVGCLFLADDPHDQTTMFDFALKVAGEDDGRHTRTGGRKQGGWWAGGLVGESWFRVFGNDLMKGTLLKGPCVPEIHRGLPVVDFCTSAFADSVGMTEHGVHSVVFFRCSSYAELPPSPSIVSCRGVVCAVM